MPATKERIVRPLVDYATIRKVRASFRFDAARRYDLISIQFERRVCLFGELEQRRNQNRIAAFRQQQIGILFSQEGIELLNRRLSKISSEAGTLST